MYMKEVYKFKNGKGVVAEGKNLKWRCRGKHEKGGKGIKIASKMDEHVVKSPCSPHLGSLGEKWILKEGEGDENNWNAHYIPLK